MSDHRRDEHDPDEAIGMFAGAAFGLAISVLAFSVDGIDRWFDDRNPLPEWIGIPLMTGIIGLGLLWAIRNRNREALVMTLSIIPLTIGGNAVRIIDPNPAWAEGLRVVGFCFVLGVLAALGPKLSSRLKELERVVFSEASSLAFFITVVVASLYGVADGFLGAPRLSFLWLPVLGTVSWVVAWSIRSRRYS
jgi:hypothetical protein